MPSHQDKEQKYLDADELVAQSGLSEATIWRLKRAGKIPFYQPGGKGSRVKFPVNALEIAGRGNRPESAVTLETETSDRLPGPRPKWMPPAQETKLNKRNLNDPKTQ